MREWLRLAIRKSSSLLLGDAVFSFKQYLTNLNNKRDEPKIILGLLVNGARRQGGTFFSYDIENVHDKTKENKIPT